MTAIKHGKVLVFDSGMGGLTVAREIQALAPDLAVDYAADSGCFPYGDKSDQALCDRLPGIAARLVEAARPDVFVIACNTASTLALDEVRARLDIPVVGTVPAIKPAAALTRTGTIGLLATPGTVRRAYTAQLIADFAQDVRVILHGSLELVRMAEEIASGGAIAMMVSQIVGADAATMVNLNLQIRNTSISQLFANAKGVHLHQFNAVPHLENPEKRDSISYS